MATFTVQYTALKFRQPNDRISESHFNYFKQEIQKDKNFRFHRYTTYFKYMRPTILSITITAAIVWGCWQYLDGSDWERRNSTMYDVLTGVCILSGLICFYQWYVWIAKNGSYIEYRKDTKNYYKGMIAAIAKSESYRSFVSNYYGE